MASDLKFEITFDSNGEPVIKKITGALDGAKTAAERAAPSFDKTDNSVKSVAKSAASAAIGMLDFGVAGNAAGNALQSVLLGAGPAAGAMAAVAVAVGFVTYQVDAQRKKWDELAETKQREIFNDNAALKYDQAIKQANKSLDSQIQLLQASDPELEAITQKFKGLSQELSKLNNPAAQNKLARAESIEINKLLDARAQASAKVTAANNAELDSEILKASAIGKSGAALAQANLALQLYALQTRAANGENAVFINGMAQTAARAAQVSEAFRQVEAGRNAAAGAAQAFGVDLGINRDQKAQSLVQSALPFLKQINSIDSTRSSEAQSVFSSLVQQLSQLGTENISGLLSTAGLSTRDLASLRSGLGNVVTGQVQQDISVPLQQRNAFGNLETLGVEVQSVLVPQITNVKELLDSSDLSSKNWGQTLDSNALAFRGIATEAEKVKRLFDEIPVERTVTINVVVNGAEQIQGLEDALVRATGANPGFRILN